MISIADKNNPSFQLFPVNNNRTGWKPFGLPIILVIPHIRDSNQTQISNSNAYNTRIYIENVPTEARVAGHDHIGLRFPDREIYSKDISNIELLGNLIDVTDYTFYRNSEVVDEIQDGDYFEYTTTDGVTERIEYISHADYYDLSEYKLDLETLPSDRYNIVYHTEFNPRIVSQDGLSDFLCIKDTGISIIEYKLEIAHPGEVLNEFYIRTPQPYFTNKNKKDDETIEFYRPFTDILQDIYDEQTHLQKVNWVFDAAPEVIPHLSSYLGWDIPYFPRSLDGLRRAVLRKTVELQSLAGSKQAIKSIFRLFGYEILISNLWWSSDGKILIRPGQKLRSPYQSEEITVSEVCQVDPVLSDYNTTGFYSNTINLLYRPQEQEIAFDYTSVRDGGSVTIEAYLVKTDSDSYNTLVELSESIKNNYSDYAKNDGYVTDSNGYILSNKLMEDTHGLAVEGFSQVSISGSLGIGISENHVGTEILSKSTTYLNRDDNILNLSINYNIQEGESVFVFAIYKRQEIIVPNSISHLQSNRFDIQVLSQDLKEYADPVTLEFAIEFLYRLKAFHSLLNIIRTKAELTESYSVTDFCVGGESTQRYDTDAGMLQVPPAIIPNIPGIIDDCSLLDPKTLGYKDDDILLRIRQLTALEEEYQAYKALDGRETSGEWLKIQPNQTNRTECQFNQYGQDKVESREYVDERNTTYSPTPLASKEIVSLKPHNLSPTDNVSNNVYDKFVSTNSNTGQFRPFNIESESDRSNVCESSKDFCYKGRVKEELLFSPTVNINEIVSHKACKVSYGTGVYYTMPTYTKQVIAGVNTKDPRSKTNRPIYSGQSTVNGIEYFKSGAQGQYITSNKLTNATNSMLGRLYRSYNNFNNETIHYSDRRTVNFDQKYQLSIQRPSLEIQKPIMHLPGCRLPTYGKLEDDYIHEYWDARPWDDFYKYCGPKFVCGVKDPVFTEQEHEVDAILDYNDEELLDMFGEVIYAHIKNGRFVALGNGLRPDIPTYGDHSNLDFDEDDVVHSVYMENAYSPYVELDQVCEFDSNVNEDGIISVSNPLFTSYNECDSSYIDYADGYKCEYGKIDYVNVDFSDWDYVLIELGMPISDMTEDPYVVFRYGSGILHEQGMRYDCGCLLAPCGTTDGDTICSLDSYIDQNGDLDFNQDHLNISLISSNKETITANNCKYNGSIMSYMETI